MSVSRQKNASSAVERLGLSFVTLAGSLAIGLMMLHICLDVTSRWILGVPIVGTLEYVAYFYMVAVVFLPLASVQAERGHVLVEVFSNLMPEGLVRWLDRGAQLFTFAYVAFIGWWGLQEAIRSFTNNEVVTIIDTDVPLWPSRFLVPLGLAAMAIVILAQLVRSFDENAEGSAGNQTHH